MIEFDQTTHPILICIFVLSVVDYSGEFHLGFTRNELQGVSWYQLLHWDSTREAQSKHRLSKLIESHVNGSQRLAL